METESSIKIVKLFSEKELKFPSHKIYLCNAFLLFLLFISFYIYVHMYSLQYIGQ